jgi:light-regulated signal transduction histidine kinase (bacteriophytochrome)/CheY-like chemotaxis protein
MPASSRTDGPTNLTNCDREPIHLLGAIQPIGFLLSVNADWIVVRASTNIHAYLDVGHDEIIGRPIEGLLPAETLHDIRGRLQMAFGLEIVERLFGQKIGPGAALFDIAVHQSAHEVVLEFEPTTSGIASAAASLRSMVMRVERQPSGTALYTAAARQVRALTGFSRVMIYRFDEDGAGEVVAEAAEAGLTPYLGLCFPAADIPVQARALYVRNLLRIIVDVDAEPVPVMPIRSPEGHPLDLSMSVLRSVSPIHLEYLRNMGVRSSMSISIMRGQRLWGLIACHHHAPKHVGLDTRSVAELFGQMFSHLLEARRLDDEVQHDAAARKILDRIAASYAEPHSFLKDVPQLLAGLADYLKCDGIGVYDSGEIELNGITPTREEFLRLVRFLNETAPGRVFSTHRLGEIFPPAADYAMRGAGLLSIPISRTARDYLVFFRREIVKTVNWAGEPSKPEDLGVNGIRLTPRKSFEAWTDIVRNTSERWSAWELRAAEALRVTLVELLLRLSETAQSDRANAQQHQEILIAELNHRVRNILGLVRGLVTQAASSATDIRVFVERCDDRIRSLARAHDFLTASNWSPASLHALLRAELDAYSHSEKSLLFRGPDVSLQPKALTAIALVIHELTTNARKYGALSVPSGQVTVTTSVDEIGNVAIAWHETGGPHVSAPTHRGFGSTILEQAIPFEINGLSKPQYLPDGFRLDLLMPAAVARCVPSSAENSPSAGESDTPADAAALAAFLKTSLIVEDNLFIAVDVEDMLRRLGAETVHVARSVAEALKLMSTNTFTFALLDVTLGQENSLPVARALKSAHVSFAFGTGYGEGLSMPENLQNVPILSKPYHRAHLVRVLTKLIVPDAAPPTSVSDNTPSNASPDALAE